MSYMRQLGLPYQWTSLWDAITKLAERFGNLTRSFCFHTSGMQGHLDSNSHLLKKYKTYACFDRTARQNA